VKFFSRLWSFLNKFLLIIAPLLFAYLAYGSFLPLDFESRIVLASAVWMVLWWASEKVPLALTALLPILIYPLTGLMDINEVSSSYATPVIFLFLGGFLLSRAIEKWKLHLKVAKKIVSIFGLRPDKIILSFIVSAAVLSMWISNSASALIMLPMAVAILKNIKSDSEDFGKALLLGVAYAASIGGIATIIGSPPNAILVAYAREFMNIEISFLKWTLTTLPILILGIFALWYYLTRIYYKIDNSKEIFNDLSFLEAPNLSSTGVGDKEQNKIAQKRASLVFFTIVLLWFTRPFLGMPGLSDTAIALFGAIMLFVLPAKSGAKEKLLDQKDFDNIPWGVLILFGGGLALAKGFQKSSLTELIVNTVAQYNFLPTIALLLILVAGAIVLTEFASNTAIVAVLLPLLSQVAPHIGLTHYSLAMAIVVSSSLSFMLPMATPPNAIFFSMGLIRFKDMFKAGFFLNIFFALLITGIAYFWFPLIDKLIK
jgi:sodium-dependent dicarboxylate transporter 2/3/5